MRRAIRALLVMVLLLGLAGGGAFLYAKQVYERPGPLAEARNLVVPRGGTEAIGVALQGAGIVEDARAFLVAATVTRGEGAVRAGEFAFPAGASLRVLNARCTWRPARRSP